MDGHRLSRAPWAGAWTAWLAAGDSIRLSHDIPGDSLPITLYADEITSWVEGGQRVFLFKGTALVEQGVVHVTMQQGAAWVDLQRGHRTGIAHLELYAEGDVKLEDGARREAGRTGFVELNTRGELRIKSQKQKVVQQPRPEDVFYQRALAAESSPTRHSARDGFATGGWDSDSAQSGAESE